MPPPPGQFLCQTAPPISLGPGCALTQVLEYTLCTTRVTTGFFEWRLPGPGVIFFERKSPLATRKFLDLRPDFSGREWKKGGVSGNF